MSSAPILSLAPEDMPLPMGVQAESGAVLPGLTAADLRHIDQDPNTILVRGSEETAFAAISDVDPDDLTQAGWGLLLPADIDPAVREALEPLIEHRRAQVGNPNLFRIFEGDSGYQPGQTVRAWLDRFRVTFALVDPEQGVPLYLLLVGSPRQIPFEFQYLLDAYWAVGRLYFESLAEYRAYAEHVVAYETAARPAQAKRVAVFNTRNLGDRATGLLHNQVAVPFAKGAGSQKPVGEKQGFKMQPFLSDDATRDQLLRLLSGQAPGGQPALLFSGSHGVGFAASDPLQKEKQGAILCQDWEGGPVAPEHYFAASDLPPDLNLNGMIHFFFACYGAGCPMFDTYSRLPDGTPKPIMEQPIVARLPQRMLASGALAVLGHIDRAWAYSFQGGRSAPQIQEFRDVMIRVMKGERLGQCTDQFNMRWAVLSAELSDTQRQQPPVSEGILANRWVARDDARNYVILGDPAVQLRVREMAP
jgi:hypothetical protein